jgi:hypothetical protein
MADTFREFGKGLIDPKYCCCGTLLSSLAPCNIAECVAVPLVNFGIYAIMGEQFVLGIGLGVAALATPKGKLRPPRSQASS